MAHGLDLISFLILGHAYQVFVKVLGRLQVLCYVSLELAAASTYCHELEYPKDELILIFVLLKFHIVLIIFQHERISELVSALHSIDPLIKSALDRCSGRIHNA